MIRDQAVGDEYKPAVRVYASDGFKGGVVASVQLVENVGRREIWAI